MKYMGSKARFHKEILQIILKDRTADQFYIEPFAGGMNMISEVDGNRIANDIHHYLIAMWKELVYNNWMPSEYTKEQYLDIRNNKDNYPDYVVGWVGFNCSYSGKWFGGFAGKTKTKLNTIRDYQQEAKNNVSKQVYDLKDVIFENKPYYELELPPNSIVYCDPPYQGTTKYANEFDHNKFWNWIREISKKGYSVYVSEYNAPEDFECIWSKEAKSSLSANGKIGGNKLSVEKLFKFVL